MGSKNKQSKQKKTVTMVGSSNVNKLAAPGDHSQALGYAVTYFVTRLWRRAPVADPRHG